MGIANRVPKTSAGNNPCQHKKGQPPNPRAFEINSLKG
jgi:hypothetical protein